MCCIPICQELDASPGAERQAAPSLRETSEAQPVREPLLRESPGTGWALQENGLLTASRGGRAGFQAVLVEVFSLPC